MVFLAGEPTLCHATAVQDEIYGDNFDGFIHPFCDGGLASDATDPGQYAQALDLCTTTTEAGSGWGLISAAFTKADQTGTPAASSHSIRTAFGSGNPPQAGSSYVVLSTGQAAASGQANPPYVAFEPGSSEGTSSGAPSDWLASNGGKISGSPNCPDAFSTTAYDSTMLTLRIRVPGNARSFSLAANFLSADFPEYVCSTYIDQFVALIDSSYNGVPANPPDKNLAVYTSPSLARYPLNVDLARDNTGLFRQCLDGATGCSSGSPSTIATCTSTAGLIGTGMDLADVPPSGSGCDANSLVGGGTGWLTIRGNVVPGETMTLRLAIWDTSDSSWDSLILLDNFQWSSSNVMPGVALN